MLLLQGDCLEQLKSLNDGCIDALVTDPPAGISFMGKAWDEDKGGRKQWVAWMTEVMAECLRVLKPGAHGLVWAIPRTSHWTATALEDAGFEIRDVVTHIFGTGFPKSMDISKAIDKQAGAEREVVGSRTVTRDMTRNGRKGDMAISGGGVTPIDLNITAPATPEAKQWDGWGTALKPASEHWILVRKRCSEETVAANVLRHGTGGINIDASRIKIDLANEHRANYANTVQKTSGVDFKGNKTGTHATPLYNLEQGRFPANLVLSHNPDCEEVGTKSIKTDSHQADKTIGFGDRKYNGKENEPERKYTETVAAFQCTPGCAVAALDEQSGELKGPWGKNSKQHVGKDGESSLFKIGGVNSQNELRGKETGGASRFFYCAKASKKDKGADNTHPTPKNTTLMSYLINLITPPGGVVLDPFMGSGSTGVSARKDGFTFVGIEKEDGYFAIAKARIESAA